MKIRMRKRASEQKEWQINTTGFFNRHRRRRRRHLATIELATQQSACQQDALFLCVHSMALDVSVHLFCDGSIRPDAAIRNRSFFLLFICFISVGFNGSVRPIKTPIHFLLVSSLSSAQMGRAFNKNHRIMFNWLLINLITITWWRSKNQFKYLKKKIKNKEKK